MSASLFIFAADKTEEHLAMLEVNEENYDEALRWFREAQSKGNRTVKSYIWYLEKKFCKEE